MWGCVTNPGPRLRGTRFVRSLGVATARESRLRTVFACTAAPARSRRAGNGPAGVAADRGGDRGDGHAVAGAPSLVDAVLARPGADPGEIFRTQSRYWQP